jgi:hypothetical protein
MVGVVTEGPASALIVSVVLSVHCNRPLLPTGFQPSLY